MAKVIWHNKGIKTVWPFKAVVHLLQINFWQMETRQQLRWKYNIKLIVSNRNKRKWGSGVLCRNRSGVYWYTCISNRNKENVVRKRQIKFCMLKHDKLYFSCTQMLQLSLEAACIVWLHVYMQCLYPVILTSVILLIISHMMCDFFLKKIFNSLYA